MFENSPPGFDHRIRELNVGLGENSFQHPRSLQLINRGIEVFRATVGHQGGHARRVHVAHGVEQELRGEFGIERSEDIPGKDPSRENVDHRTQVNTAAIEQTDQRGVDVPDFIGSRRADADLRLDRMHPLARTTPAGDANQSMPSAWRGEDLAESLGKASEPAGRHMPIFIGRDHVLD